MARATLEMFLKLTGADKTSKGLDKVSGSANRLDKNVKNSSKANAQFAAGMSGLTKGAIAGAAIFAGKALINFSADALEAAVSAEEAAAAFGTTFGDAAQDAARFTDEFANKAGLTSAELKQLLSTLGAVTQGIGFTQKESADLGIELTKIAADVASFSNISQGAEPVLRAFQSALLGENEALKSYGLAILSSEVDTKAFEMTSKTTTAELTKQERALATLALIQQKAAVQIGDLDRTSESFANQQRAVSAEIRQLKEDIGAELIPAAAEMLPIFRELVNDIAPPTINFFKQAALFSAELALSFEALSLKAERLQNNFPKINAGLERYINFLMRITPQGRLLNSIEDLAEKQRELNIATDMTAENIIAQHIAQGLANKETRTARTQTNLLRVSQEKYETLLNKKSLPTLEKYLEYMNLINGENEDGKDKSKELANAQDNLAEAQRNEALATAEEALQKKELQKEIAELLFFQKQGVDVSEELAVAQEKLKLVEFELTRESEELRDAKADLADIEAELVPKVEETTNKLAEQAAEFLALNEKVELFKELAADEEFMAIAREAGEANPFLSEGLGYMSQLAELQGLDERAQELNNFAIAAERLAKAQAGLFDEVPRKKLTPPPKKDPRDLLPPDYVDPALKKALEGVGGSETPANTIGDQGNINKGGTQETKTVVEANFIVNDEIIQKVVTEAQQKGKVFVI